MTPDASVSVVGPTADEVIHLGPVQMRILEDGHTMNHRLGLVEGTLPPHTAGPVQHRHTQHDEGFYMWSQARHSSRLAQQHMMRLRIPW